MNLTRITRLVKLLGLLQSGRGHNATSLAQECSVSRRTVFRDLETFREAGVPLVFDEECERYHIPSTFFLPPTNFSAEEALAVIVLCNELGAKGQLPFYAAAQSAALKLESSLPSRLREDLKLLTRAVRIQLDHVNSEIEEHKTSYQQLIDAVATRQAVRIQYDSFTEGEVLTTKLSPYQVLFSRRSWYVIGRSSVHRETRTFNIARISEMESLSDTFKIPRGFSIERYLRNAWHLIPESGPDSEVEIRFSPMVAKNVAEVGWHKTQETEFLPDGSLLFRVKVSGLSEISWWALGYGDQAEVLRPQALRDLLAQRAQRMAEQYMVEKDQTAAPQEETSSEGVPLKEVASNGAKSPDIHDPHLLIPRSPDSPHTFDKPHLVDKPHSTAKPRTDAKPERVNGQS